MQEGIRSFFIRSSEFWFEMCTASTACRSINCRLLDNRDDNFAAEKIVHKKYIFLTLINSPYRHLFKYVNSSSLVCLLIIHISDHNS